MMAWTWIAWHVRPKATAATMWPTCAEMVGCASGSMFWSPTPYAPCVARRAAAMMSMRKALVAARKAGLNATQLRNHMSKATEDVAAPVTENDFLDALKKVQSSVSGSDLKRFENWMETYGSI